jgi:hypothetical protein
MLRHFMRFQRGWWVLHVVAVAATLMLGGSVGFWQ